MFDISRAITGDDVLFIEAENESLLRIEFDVLQFFIHL